MPVSSSDVGLILWATDIPAFSSFLENVCAMTIVQRHPGFASLDLNGASVMLHDDESYRGHPWYEALRKEGLARGVGAELRFRVADVDASYLRALRLGAAAVQAPADYEGTRECQVMGPDGYLFSLWQASPRSE
jgi:catechol 2,3-dioxygenase-like lactoylglutathione lyase family enzyme